MAEIIGKDYIYSRKVNPADIAVQVIDEDYIRKELRGTLNAVYKYGCGRVSYEDIRTLAHNRIMQLLDTDYKKDRKDLRQDSLIYYQCFTNL